MKISYVSDLHLEFGDYPKILDTDAGGDVLILAGDIVVANYLRKDRTDKSSTKLKKHMSNLKTNLFDKYGRVLYVLGNHEHYNGIYKNTLKTLRNGLDDLGLIEKVTLLEDDHTVIDGVPFIGATLWTDFFKGDPSAMYIAERGMNDFHVIGSMDVDDMTYFNRYQSRAISPSFVLDVHKKSLEYIDYITNFYKAKDCVVITHHAPTYKSLNSKHSGNSLDAAYASDLSEFILDHGNIKYWIHGHCHMNTDYFVGGCSILSNQRGYKGEDSHTLFDGLKSFTI
jgi:Icc-related predicted phosphoesterase